MKRIATGIYRGPSGFRVFQRIARGRGGLKSRRFDKLTALSTMKAWQEEQRVEARKEPSAPVITGTLAADVARYLTQIAAMPTLSWRKRDLAAWTEAFGDMKRAEISSGLIRAQLHEWRTVGPIVRFNPKTKERRRIVGPLSASACNHRRTALLHLYTVLDGKEGKNPVRAVPEFTEPPPTPRARDLEFLDAARQRMQNAKDRARVGVLMWTGARGNCELGKMTRQHLDLRGRTCQIPTGKGGTRLRIVVLNDRGVEAWKEFAAANAWGKYDKNLLRKSFKRACRSEAIARNLPAESVRPYDLRHSIATALLKAGADLSDVQDMLGHTTSRMTRRYAPFQREKLAMATMALEQTVPPAKPKVTGSSYQHRGKGHARNAIREK